MGFKNIKLNDGREIPAIGYGTWKIGYGEDAISQIQRSISLGFDHVDTAQVYRNETETGDALIRSGIERKDVWITTKFSGSVPGLSIRASIEESLKKVSMHTVFCVCFCASE
jgi:diketogulonate reductase-like aldo/keto reductase